MGSLGLVLASLCLNFSPFPLGSRGMCWGLGVLAVTGSPWLSLAVSPGLVRLSHRPAWKLGFFSPSLSCLAAETRGAALRESRNAPGDPQLGEVVFPVPSGAVQGQLGCRFQERFLPWKSLQPPTRGSVLPCREAPSPRCAAGAQGEPGQEPRSPSAQSPASLQRPPAPKSSSRGRFPQAEVVLLSQFATTQWEWAIGVALTMPTTQLQVVGRSLEPSPVPPAPPLPGEELARGADKTIPQRVNR